MKQMKPSADMMTICCTQGRGERQRGYIEALLDGSIPG